ncbi:hypothetical protein ABVT39_009717 [Epinephelus coioides]
MLWSLLLMSLIGCAHLKDHETALSQKVTTSQSSDYQTDGVKYTSERAIDGNLSKCAHTLELPSSWWRIDLLGVYRISSICIYNIKQHNTDISGAQIFIGNSSENNGTTNYMCNNIADFTPGQWYEVKCNAKMSGRYITVFLPASRNLILCEVKICSTKKESPFQLIPENKTWEDALYYCQDRHMDLASIVDEETQAWAELEAKKAQTPYVWLGLRYSCPLDFWFWVNDQCVKFSHWDRDGKIEECDMSVAMETKEDHLWSSKPDHKKFNFICAKQQVQAECNCWNE